MLYIRMFLVLIVTLYTSRVVIAAMGVEDYGVYNVVSGFVAFFGFLNVTLSSSMQRFYNYDIGGNEGKDIPRIYSTGLMIHLALAVIILLILESVGLWYINNVMVVPEGRLGSANILFQIVIASLICVILQIPYLGAVMAYEHMNFYAIVGITEVVLKLLAVIALPYLPGDKLILYGLIVFSVNLISLGLYFVYSKTKCGLHFKRGFDKGIFRSILSFSSWNLLGTFAFMLKGQALNLVLNYFFGTVINAARGIATQASGAVNGFAANVATAFRPQIVNSYAAGEHERVVRLMFLESKICFFLLSILMIPLMIEIKYILNLWLDGIVPEHTAIFTVLACLDLLICSLNMPCTQVAFAVGRIKWYQIITSVITFTLVPASYVLLSLGLPPESVFVATIVFSVLYQGACLLILNRLCHFGLRSYLFKVAVPCFLLMVLLPLLPYAVTLVLPSSFLRVCLVVLVDVIVGLGAGYFLFLQKEERKVAMNFFKTRLHLR